MQTKISSSSANSSLKVFLKYATLNVLGMIGLSCYILADTFFVSNGLGTNGLTALNLAIPIYSFVHGVGLMLGMGGATKYVIFKSQGETKRANEIFTKTMILALMSAICFVTAGLLGARTITQWMGANQEVFDMTCIYIRVILLFSPMFLLNEVLLCFVRNDGNPKLSMLAMLGGSFGNIILDYIYIFPLRLGMFGAVLATGTAPIISMLIQSSMLFKKQNQFHFCKISEGSELSGTWKDYVQIATIGFPSLVTEVSAGIVMIIFNTIILNLQGNVGVAAYGVIANLAIVVVSIYNGIAQGVQPLFSEQYGKGDVKEIQNLLRYALVLVAMLSFLIYVGIVVGADAIIAVFNSENNAELAKIANTGLKIYFLSGVFMGMNIIFSIYFASTEKILPAHMISLVRGFFLIIPLSYLLSNLWGMLGVWMALPVTEGIVAVMAVIGYGIQKMHRKNR